MNSDKPERLLRLKDVLDRIPVSKSTCWDGVKNGRFPQPIKLSARTTAWKESDIDRIVNGEH